MRSRSSGNRQRVARPRQPTRARKVVPASHQGSSTASSVTEAGPSNPLEALRVERDPARRAALMAQLDTRMSHWSERYTPSPVEAHLAEALGVWSYNVMLFAVASPALSALDLESQVRPAVASLKAAGLEATDIWFLATKRLELLEQPIALQRWLDWLAVQALSSRDMANFLLRAPKGLFTGCTQGQAMGVLGYLKSLGIKQEYLFPRVVCICPGVLTRDVQAELQPVVGALLALGLEAQDVSRMACVYPELLLVSVEQQLAPLVDYLRELGCSTHAAGRLLLEVPQALRCSPLDAFGGRVAALAQLGLSGEVLRSVVQRSHAFLITKGAPGEQIAFLRDDLGLSTEQVASLVAACPAILSEKPLELQRKVDFLRQELNMELPDALAHPAYLGASLMQVIGPRHAFALAKGLEAKLHAPGATCSAEHVAEHGGAWGWDLSLLVAGEDIEFVDGVLGGSINEFEGYRTAFEEEYSARLSAAAAAEFQAELKKLGIYEGA